MKNSFSADHNHHSERKPSVTPNLPRKVEEKGLNGRCDGKKDGKRGTYFHLSLCKQIFLFLYPSALRSVCDSLPSSSLHCPKTCGEISSVRCSCTMADEKPTVLRSRASAGGRSNETRTEEAVGRTYSQRLCCMGW